MKWVAFGTAFAFSVVLSPLFVIYEAFAGLVCLFVAFTVLIMTGKESARTAVAVFSGVFTGSFPYLLAGLAINL